MEKQYGKWLVIGKPYREPYKHLKVLCRCSCGFEKEVYIGHLQSGFSKNCRRCANVKHGCGKRTDKNTLERSTYSSYRNMKSRCVNPGKHKSAKCYRDRPVRLCKRWLKGGFKVFLQDMGLKPTLKHSLDRVNNNLLLYSPGNCRWATAMQQTHNSQLPKLITWEAQTKCISEWEKFKKVSRGFFAIRIQRGWSIEETFTIPKGNTRANFQK